ncbi:eukaryotic translation initiation factor 4E type 2 isoform X1 [Nannospalax galili]|uniref:eukaryotic translation initiation factor 4E type 2 isoform X1 n=1 Tax=Nannospalax galili TaxID=1026970 RepID=UPI00111C72FC|nr:eukaryotic translation initiation factor 4E type 2 isoform X1 [Nannospalax galili]
MGQPRFSSSGFLPPPPPVPGSPWTSTLSPSSSIEPLREGQHQGSEQLGALRMQVKYFSKACDLSALGLKDDDSGDHDQNEENSTQKDGEKEKTERDKSQSSSKRKAVVPGPAEHPLQYNYTFWYSRRTPGRPTSSQSYEQNIKQIGTFASVEQFWRFYSHMVRPGDLTGHSDFHLFKEGIKPMWEDDANKNGGKWIIRLRKGLASRCWENLILAMLGEQFMVGEEICGAVVSVRFQEDIISIWNKTASDQATTARIRDTLRRVLNLPPNTIMEYKTHTDSIKAWEEFHGLVNSSGR